MKRIDEEVIRRAMMAIQYVCELKPADDLSRRNEYCSNCPALIVCANGWQFQEPVKWLIRQGGRL